MTSGAGEGCKDVFRQGVAAASFFAFNDLSVGEGARLYIGIQTGAKLFIADDIVFAKSIQAAHLRKIHIISHYHYNKNIVVCQERVSE